MGYGLRATGPEAENQKKKLRRESRARGKKLPRGKAAGNCVE